MGDGSSPYWLGYYEKAGDEYEGQWHWADGDAATFTFWGGAEPNNYYRDNFPEGEDCMCFWHGPKWNDWWCDKEASSMCKKVTSYECTPGAVSIMVSQGDDILEKEKNSGFKVTLDNGVIKADAWNGEALGSYTITVTN